MQKPLAALSSIAALAAALALGAPAARADVAPPDSCTAPGQPCQNAGPQFDGSGTCVTTTCTRQVPSADGGTMSMSYDCNLCRAPDAGAGGSGGGGSGGSTASSGSSGCGVAPGPGGTGDAPASILLLVGLLVAVGRRRASLE